MPKLTLKQIRSVLDRVDSGPIVPKCWFYAVKWVAGSSDRLRYRHGSDVLAALIELVVAIPVLGLAAIDVVLSPTAWLFDKLLDKIIRGYLRRQH